METTASPSRSKKGSAIGKFFGFLVVLGLIGLVVVLDMQRRQAEQKLTELSMKYDGANPSQNQEAAKEIVARVRKIYSIPAGIDPTVATIVDVTQLRARNAFYNKAKNGDHLIVTSDRAILYDPIADKIIDVVPVQIQEAAASSVSTSAAASLSSGRSTSSARTSSSAVSSSARSSSVSSR